jgi:hypothetical protein
VAGTLIVVEVAFASAMVQSPVDDSSSVVAISHRTVSTPSVESKARAIPEDPDATLALARLAPPLIEKAADATRFS